ncbi:MAG: acyl-ACP--UDP-N-acetylglucosamine O-acyltransferase [Planctomycetota bacterium]
MNNIHPTAIIEKGAEIADNAIIGAYSIIGPNVKIGSDNRIGHHCNITGYTAIGKNNNFSPFCSIGTGPQDIGYKNEPTKLTIGDNNTFKEFITINTGTLKDNGETIVGNNNYLMAYCHVGHDGILGDNIIMANGVQLGGHVNIGNYVSLGGLAGVHHLVTIGEHAFVGGAAKIIQDVPPYMIAEGNPGKVRSLNIIGLQRRGFSKETITALEESYKLIWRSKLTSVQAFQQLLSAPESNTCKEVLHLIQFLQNTYKGKFGRYKESLRKIPAR